MKKLILSIILFLVLTSCVGGRVIDVKSPCVSGKGGPCDRQPVNTWLS